VKHVSLLLKYVRVIGRRQLAWSHRKRGRYSLLQLITCYPFQDDDPFVMTQCPHLFVVGSQPKLDRAVIEGPDGQMVRLIAVPRFSETGEVVLVGTETLEVERVIIDVFDSKS
jgi:DNA polymerase II small subunit/DNA polymerase delta subunit B